jgi:hypothetical protein
MGYSLLVAGLVAAGILMFFPASIVAFCADCNTTALGADNGKDGAADEPLRKIGKYA